MKNRLSALSIICLMGLSGLCESKIPGTNLSAMAVPGNARAAAPTDKWDMEKLSRPVKTWPMPQSFRSTRIRWPHGHGEVSEGPREIQVFADHFTKGSPQLPSFKGFSTSGGRVSAQFDACGRTVKCVHLVYTEDMNPSWPKREFKTGTAHFDEATGGIVAEVPEGAALYYLNVETEDGLVSSSRWGMKGG